MFLCLTNLSSHRFFSTANSAYRALRRVRVLPPLSRRCTQLAHETHAKPIRPTNSPTAHSTSHTILSLFVVPTGSLPQYKPSRPVVNAFLLIACSVQTGLWAALPGEPLSEALETRVRPPLNTENLHMRARFLSA
ncbi:hypothetical protein BDV98DRAFT_564534 [Pterulicium gracile]|uniref:Uncharacterized protein n=1 Tax=Pterulicium gracile TaxID=1884261 RepID=A0A5C3QSZ0_9AGAR|nr:hypothetical protein BDV98DRAFT_564534 [Pterula gracilis]